MEFKIFVNEMISHFNEMTNRKDYLFVTDVNKDEIWDAYLNQFPEENGIRQSYNCNSCKSFLRQWGGLVVINDDLSVESLWDFIPSDDEVKSSVEELSKYVKSKPICDVFINTLNRVGVERNRATLPSGEVIYWNHLYLDIPRKFITNLRGRSIDSVRGDFRSKKDALYNSLERISSESIDVVLDLINQGALYRGNEYMSQIKSFKKVKSEYDILDSSVKDTFCWIESTKVSDSVAKVRGTVIGQLMSDITDGVDLDSAVTSYERMVAPSNYKRPKAIVSKKMIDDAKKTIESLGLMDSLPRRHATIDDININDIIYIDRGIKRLVSGGLDEVFESMRNDVQVNPKSLKKVTEMSIDDFINNVLPNSLGMEVLFESRHISNLMTLTAPVNKDSKSLFKWDNGFSWSYKGDVTDSIKEKVKAAGGNINAVLRCSLHWFNYDDLDIHVIEPGGHEIFYRDRENSRTSGKLDIDMNAGSGTSRDAVENITWTDPYKMREGRYKLIVNNFCKRERIDEGFECEIEYNGVIYKFNYSDSVKNGENIIVAEFNWSKNNGIEFISSINESVNGLGRSITEWNIGTNKYHKVNLVMLSPNYWGNNSIGNKHYFFIIDECKNPDSVRGFYNEYLNPELDKHKRVFEVLGDKMKSPYSDNQLSGLGFSSTKRDDLIVKVKGSFDRVIKIKF